MSTQIDPLSLGRGAAGGLGSLWPLCIPATLISVAIDAYFVSPWWVVVFTVVGVLALWYFLVARIPGQLRVRSIRKEVADAIIFTVRLDGFTFNGPTSTGKSIRAGRPRIGGTALAATAESLQIWAGRVGDPYPVHIVAWSTIESLSPLIESIMSAQILVKLKDGDQFEFRAATDRPFIAEYRRGRARGRLVAQLVAMGKLRPRGLT